MHYSFCLWLNKFENVILVAHHGTQFDFPVLISFVNAIKLFISILHVFLVVLTHKHCSVKCFEKEHHTRRWIWLDHDALEDVKALGSLTVYACDRLSTGDILHFSFSTTWVFHAQQFNDAKAEKHSIFE